MYKIYINLLGFSRFVLYTVYNNIKIFEQNEINKLSAFYYSHGILLAGQEQFGGPKTIWHLYTLS
jgi:hypothetical protein